MSPWLKSTSKPRPRLNAPKPAPMETEETIYRPGGLDCNVPSWKAIAHSRTGSTSSSEVPFDYIISPSESVTGILRNQNRPADDLLMPMREVFLNRFSVLVSLMLCQSLSSVILQKYSKLLTEHHEVTLFLTMLVGAGGNAGNQVAVTVIRGIATERIDTKEIWKGHGLVLGWGTVVIRETLIGFMLAFALCFIAYFRVILFVDAGPIANAIAFSVCIACCVIVLVSAAVGALLPLGLLAIGMDPAHAGPAVQVIMDVFGVYATCVIARAIL